MQITFMGAAQTVTGSKYLITTKSQKILIDCGLYQGYKELRMRNWSNLPLDPAEIDAVVLTHAHIDHSGYLPLLVKNGFKGKIFSTRGSKDLCAILLPDSGHIQEEDVMRANKYGYSKHHPALPLYTKDEGLRTIDHFHTLEYENKYELFKSINVTLLPAGHIIGSAIVRLEIEGKTIVFTGDLGRPHHPVMKAPTLVTDADYLIVESTYGDRLHEQTNPLDQIAEVVQHTVYNGGSIIIPAFAVGRSQDIMYMLYQLKKANRIPDIPVFLDSPMAENVSDLLIRYSSEHRLSPSMCKEVCAVAQYVKTPNESKAIDQYPVPVIIISASGMAEAGRILYHLKTFLPNHRNSILLTGYQDPGTRGDRLLKGETAIKIHGEMVPVRARIAVMNNMSAHADYQEMLDWLSHFREAPRKVFITHGDKESSHSLKNKIEERFRWTCEVPEYLQSEVL